MSRDENKDIKTCVEIVIGLFLLTIKLVFYGYVIAFMYKHW